MSDALIAKLRKLTGDATPGPWKWLPDRRTLWAYVDGKNWNASALHDHWPPSFVEARKWVAAFAARYGQAIIEKKREKRRPKPPLRLVK